MRKTTTAMVGLAVVIGAGSFLDREPDDLAGQPIVGTYTSARYAYTLDPPEGWTVEPATSDWRVVDPWDEAPAADVFWSPDGLRFTVVGDPVHSGIQRTIYAQALVPDRPIWDRDGRSCRFFVPPDGPMPTPIVDGRRLAWLPERIGSHVADVRAACGYVDAVILHESYAYVISLAGPPRTDGDLVTFRRLVATFVALDRPAAAGPTPTPMPRWTPRPEPTEPTLGPLAIPFVSPRYAYTVEHPADWVAQAATHSYRPGEGRLTRAPVADVLERAGSTRLTVVALDLDPPADLDAWLERWAPSRYAFDHVCKFGGTMMPGSTLGWQATTVAGHDARIRSQCAYAEAAIRIGDRLWYVAHHSGRRVGHGDRTALDAFLETMTFDPKAPLGAPDEGTEVRSSRYDYVIRIPTDWTSEAATEDFVAGRSWRAGRGADQYLGPAGETFSVAALRLPSSMTVATWLDRYARSRSVIQSGHVHCRFQGETGTTTVEAAAPGWDESTVAGLPALVRSDCASIDAAVLDQRRLYILSHDRGHPYPNGDRTAFDRLAGTLWLNPGTPLDRAP